MQQQDTPPSDEHYIVAIGASAGGLEAIHEFFDNMPSTGIFSFVIIQHLSSDYKSLLVELVAKHTNMQVREAAHNARMEKGCVYVIPNDKLLTVNGGRLQLSEKNTDKVPNTAIDTFLKSLAEDGGPRAIAVILSGTGTDGTRGIHAIQTAGGMVLVQDPASAKFNGMPNSAIAAGYADFILPPELMPAEILNYIQEKPYKRFTEGKPDESFLPEVLKLIDHNCHYDFYNYKVPTIMRRISRRMEQLGCKSFDEYLELLRSSSEECTTLGKDFLIGVTRFFRDTEAFKILEGQVLPHIIKTKKDGDLIKIWVTACSTGEEAYSIAMLVNKQVEESGKNIDVKIFATDIDADAIEHASRGIYSTATTAEMDEELLFRNFILQSNTVTVSPHLRKQIVFACHNILKDPPFIKNDLVTCRNMLIYMNGILQRKVFAALQFALHTGGYMFLGPSEIPASIKDNLHEISSKWKIYRKTTAENRYNPERYDGARSSRGKEIKSQLPRQEHSAAALSEDLTSLLTEECSFAAVYVDRSLEIKEATGNFKKYLFLPDNITSLQLLKMVKKELGVALNSAIRRSVKEHTRVNLKNLRTETAEGEKFINIYIKPVSEHCTLIVFGESYDMSKAAQPDEFIPQHSFDTTSYIAELEEELKETRINLQMAVEGLETSNEELQSSNEELLSANEELQSSNEELQSLNEELHTLNTEHQLRIKELIDLNDDLNNYFRSTQLAQIFLDTELRIRKFNPVAVEMINLIETDIGRPIEHVSTNISNSDLMVDIRQVLRQDEVIEKEVTLNNGSISLMRILPYIRQDKQIGGVVITFVDISRIKELDNMIKGVFNASQNIIMAFRSIRDDSNRIVDFKWTAANHQADRFIGQQQEEYLDKKLKDSFPALFVQGLFERYVSVVTSGQPLYTEVNLNGANGAAWYELVASQMKDGLVLTLINVSEKKAADEKFRKNYRELMNVKENYRHLNKQLEDKVTERTHTLSLSEERFRLVANATSDAVWDWNLVNNEVWWSDSFYKRFGYKKDGTTLKASFWLDHVHPDDKAGVNESIHDAINTGSDWECRYRFQMADGSYTTIRDKGRVLTDAEGIPYRMVGAMTDTSLSEIAEQTIKVQNTELQKLIQEFKFVTDFMPQIVWATRKDGYHEFYNKQWYDFTGLTYEQTKDKGWSLVLHPDDYDRTWKIWTASLETGNPYETEYRMRRYDGSYRWLLARALPLKNEKGTVIKWFGTCTDIHDQKLANDTLEQKVKERTADLQKINGELEVSNSDLMQFASVASHDLKEPLRKIHMFSHIIRDKFVSDFKDGASSYLERIISSSERMTNLINDLLTFSRLSVASDAYEVTKLDSIIKEVLNDLELQITEKGAKIEYSRLPALEIIPGQMRQVFQNLISNALKFSKETVKPQITITAERVRALSFIDATSDEGDYYRITVQDNGIGFGKQYVDKIFTIFQRLHSREKYEGTGIGLSITRKIVEKHNGIITAKSEEGQGASFMMVLPVRQAVEAVISLN